MPSNATTIVAQVRSGRIDFFVLFFVLAARAVTGFLVAGRLLIGRSARPDDAAWRGSGPNWMRQGGESSALRRTMQAVTRSTSGISELQSRKASLVHACSCSAV